MNHPKHVSMKDYWEYFMAVPDAIRVLYPEENMTESERRELFLRFVYVVNLELSTECNRRCPYCPVSIYPRGQEHMEEKTFDFILQNLREIGYSGMMMLNFFNEPLMDDTLMAKIKKTRKYLPESWIIFNSNGDFLTRELLKELYLVGLNQIKVTLHPGGAYDDSDRRTALEKFLQKLGLHDYFGKREETPGKNITLDLAFSSKRRILILCDNWQKYGNDRGGTLESLKAPRRTSPCVNPFREVFIAYDGTVKSCCNIYFGADDVYGNAGETSLTDLYFSRRMTEFRRSLFSFSPKSGGCATCNTPDTANEESKTMRDEILGRGAGA